MARMLHEWSAGGQANIPPVVKAVAVVTGAFLVTGILYFAAQQLMSVASRRVDNRYAPRYAAYDENNSSTAAPAAPFSPTFGAPLNGPQQFGAPSSSASSGRTGGVMRFGQSVPSTQATAPPPTGGNNLFNNDSELQAARAQVKALRGTLTTLKQYDNASLWAGVTLIEQARQAEHDAALTPAAGSSVTLNEEGSAPDKFATADEAADVRLRVSRKLLGELEAINGEVGLSAHPGHFPDPLHDDAEAVGSAMRTYLETARMAVARPYEASVLKTRAGKELARVEELVRAMETPISGGASAAN